MLLLKLIRPTITSDMSPMGSAVRQMALAYSMLLLLRLVWLRSTLVLLLVIPATWTA
jgi:hypothetical protein